MTDEKQAEAVVRGLAGKRHWYHVTIVTCPCCSSEKQIRERRPLPRPDAWSERHEWVQHYDYCNDG